MAYADSTLVAENKRDRRSPSGRAVLCAGSRIRSLKQWHPVLRRVTLSTTESRYYTALVEVHRLVSFCQILDCVQPGCMRRPVPMFDSNDGATKLAEENIFTSRTKHVNIRYQFARGEAPDEKVRVVDVESHGRCADRFI